jgi:hypothetical protein
METCQADLTDGQWQYTDLDDVFIGECAPICSSIGDSKILEAGQCKVFCHTGVQLGQPSKMCLGDCSLQQVRGRTLQS